MGTVVGHPAYASPVSVVVCGTRYLHAAAGRKYQQSVGRERGDELTGFVSNVIVARLVPILAAFCVLKAALDAAEGHSPLASIVAGTFLL